MPALKTRKIPAAVTRTLVQLSEQSYARLIIVNENVYLLARKEHKLLPANAFAILREKRWITTPEARGTELAECSISEQGKAAAASIKELQSQFTQLELDIEIIDKHIKATQLELDAMHEEQPQEEQEPEAEQESTQMQEEEQLAYEAPEEEEQESKTPQRTAMQCLYDLRQHCLEQADIAELQKDIDDLAQHGYIPYITHGGSLDVQFYGRVYGNPEYEHRKARIFAHIVTILHMRRQAAEPAATAENQPETSESTLQTQETPETQDQTDETAEQEPKAPGMYIQITHACNHVYTHYYPTAMHETLEAVASQLCPDCLALIDESKTEQPQATTLEAPEEPPQEEEEITAQIESAPTQPQEEQPTPTLAEIARRTMPKHPDIIRAVVYGVPETTPEQIARCHRIETDEQPVYYIVESEHIPGLCYKVTYHVRFSCTCSSGREHFAGISHPSSVCPHVRYALAASLEHRAAQYQSHQPEPEPPTLPIPTTVAATAEGSIERVLNVAEEPPAPIERKNQVPDIVLDVDDQASTQQQTSQSMKQGAHKVSLEWSSNSYVLSHAGYQQIEALIQAYAVCHKCEQYFTAQNPNVAGTICLTRFLWEYGKRHGVTYVGPGAPEQDGRRQKYLFLSCTGMIRITYPGPNYSDNGRESVTDTLEYWKFPNPQEADKNGKTVQLTAGNWAIIGDPRRSVVIVHVWGTHPEKAEAYFWISKSGNMTQIARRKASHRHLLAEAKLQLEATKQNGMYYIGGREQYYVNEYDQYRETTELLDKNLYQWPR